MARVPCLDAGESFFTIFRRNYEGKRRTQGWITAAHEAWQATERDLLRSYGAERRFADRLRGTRATFMQILYGVRPPGDLFDAKFYGPIQSGLRLVQRELARADQIRIQLHQYGAKPHSRASIAMGEIMDTLPVSELAKLDNFNDDALMAIARTQSPEAEAVVGESLKHIREQMRPVWRDGLLLFREMRQHAEGYAKDELIKAGKEATQEAIEDYLGGPTLSAYATHFIRDLTSDYIRDEVFDRAAPWIKANHAELMDTLERALALNDDGTGILGQGNPFVLIKPGPLGPDGKPTEIRFESKDLAEVMGELLPGFAQRFTAPAARAKFYQELRGAFAQERNRFTAVASVIPDNIWVRYFQERRGGADYELDFVRMLESYVPSVARKIHLEPIVNNLTGKASGMTPGGAVAALSVGRPELRMAMHDYINTIMGRDRPLFPALHRAAAWITQKAYKGTLLGNLSATVTNMTQPLLFTIPEAGFRDAISGIKLLATPEWREKFREIGDQIFMQVTPFDELPLHGRFLDSMRRIASAPDLMSAVRITKDSVVSAADTMARVEYWNRMHAFATGFAKTLRETGALDRPAGQLEDRVLQRAIESGNRMIERTQFLFLSTSQPAFIRAINRLPGGQALTMFANFPIQAANRLTTWVTELGHAETRAGAMAKLSRAAIMGNIVAGPFWFAPWLRERLENDENETADDFLRAMDTIESELSIAGWMGIDLASKTSPASIIESAFAVAQRTGFGGATLAGRAGLSQTPLPRFITSALGAINSNDPFEREVLSGRVFGALAPMFGGRAPEGLPWFAIPPDFAPFVPGGVALNRFVRSIDVLMDPDRQYELGLALQLDEKGRPRAVTSRSQEIRRQFGTPIEEMKIALRGRVGEARGEERKLQRQTLKRLVLDGRGSEAFTMLNEHPELADALDENLLEQEAATRSLLPQARAFRTMPELEAVQRFQAAADRLADARLSPAERVIEEQIVMLGVARFKRR